jgi:hypothetical protein
VQLGGDDNSSQSAPDDILFANGATPPADASWGLLDEDVGSLLPGGGGVAAAMDFGNDILGAEAAAPAVAAPVRARPAQKPRPGIAATGRPAAPMPTQRPVVEATRIAAPAASPVVVRRPAKVRLGPGSRVTGLLVPGVVFAAGGTLAAWLYAMQQNHVMGGIVVGLSVIAATFTRVFLRG